MKIVLIPPLLCSPLAYAPVLDTVWTRGQVTLADTRHDDTIAAMAERILRENAGDIAVLGTSMEGTSPSKSSDKHPTVSPLSHSSARPPGPTPRNRSERGRASPRSSKPDISTLWSTPPSLASSHQTTNPTMHSWPSGAP
ncbi:alpha/Beta hydrolase [Arthrobacter sp. Hiyo6]|nr:alpha/Beta hydrolase [Arthrobacter sp. Hiyo6]